MKLNLKWKAITGSMTLLFLATGPLFGAQGGTWIATGSVDACEDPQNVCAEIEDPSTGSPIKRCCIHSSDLGTTDLNVCVAPSTGDSSQGYGVTVSQADRDVDIE